MLLVMSMLSWGQGEDREVMDGREFAVEKWVEGGKVGFS